MFPEPGHPLMLPWAMRVAATLRLADLMDEGLSRPEQFATRSGAHAGSVERLLRYLVCRGCFIEPEPGRFALNDQGETLLSDHPSGMRGCLDIDGPFGRTDQAISHLLSAVRTGRPAYAEVHGRPFFDDLAGAPERSAVFDDVMRRRLAVDLPHLLQGYDWTSVGSVADVGGGTGGLLAALLAAHPRLRGTLVELPATARRAERFLREQGLTGRCEIAARDHRARPVHDAGVRCRGTRPRRALPARHGRGAEPRCHPPPTLGVLAAGTGPGAGLVTMSQVDVYYDLCLRLMGPLRTTLLTGEQLCEIGRIIYGRPERFSLYGVPAPGMEATGIRVLGRTSAECCVDEMAVAVGSQGYRQAGQSERRRVSYASTHPLAVCRW
ncbi:methyltransferase [Nonomuraea sp. WAC 01424]|uniref:methyltransferase n=1 Tax=Nonomuraea sp. WAC 01424 TaxID=2203200 RepID=UPI00163BD1F4|nr:methyltransferase [Nonomuraea sp. WAC 01424]